MSNGVPVGSNTAISVECYCVVVIVCMVGIVLAILFAGVVGEEKFKGGYREGHCEALGGKMFYGRCFKTGEEIK